MLSTELTAATRLKMIRQRILVFLAHLCTARAICLSEKPSCLAFSITSGGMALSFWTGRVTLAGTGENQDRGLFPPALPHLVVGLQQPLVVGYVLHLVQEPAVDLGELVQLVHRVAGPERRRQNEDTLICRRLQLLVTRGERSGTDQLLR